MATTAHSAAPHHMPAFFTAPGETDVLMVVMAIVLVAILLGAGNLFLRLHTLPERMAHKSQKFQFEVVAVLGLLALFTHQHVFWVAGLLLAMVDLPDFGTPLRRIAGSVESIAGLPPGEGATAADRIEQERQAEQQHKHEESVESIGGLAPGIGSTAAKPMKEKHQAGQAKHEASHA
jgi:hypothetical protein